MEMFNEEEKIYFGIIPMYLYPCTGIYRNFDINKIKKEEINEKNIEKILKRTKDLSYINEKYKNYYLFCIPETDIIFESNIEENKTEKGPEEFLSNPFIKFYIKMKKDSEEYEKLNKLMGVMSGERSAIVKCKNGKFYRLKGCGDFKEGFTLMENNYEIKKIYIRGCQLENNVFRELYYTYKINEILKKNDIECSNIPIGYWKYNNNLQFIDNSLNEKNIIENSASDIDKYCSIYETISDKRLGVHLLKGIEKILESIIQTSIEQFNFNQNDLDNIKKFYAENNRSHKPIISLPDNISLKEFCKNPIYQKKHYDKLITYQILIEKIKSNESLKKIILSSNLIDNWSQKLEKKLNCTFDYYNNIIEHLISAYKNENNNNKSIFEHLLDIFIRIGYETAKIKRIFQEENFNWGSFNGQSQIDIFCSSHFNNFIVLPSSKSSLLSPIDFDLAFSKENFINSNIHSESFGKFDQRIFDEYLIRELNTLIENLSGFYISNNISFEEDIKQYVYNLLNDSLIEIFMKTFDGIKCNYLISYKKFNNIHYDLIKISLISTLEKIS